MRRDHDEPQPVLCACMSKALRARGAGWRLTFSCTCRMKLQGCDHVLIHYMSTEGQEKEK